MPNTSQSQRHSIDTIPPISKPSIQNIYIPRNPTDPNSFLYISGRIQESPLSCNQLIITDFPPPLIPSVASNHYGEILQEINLVPKPHTASSIQYTPTLDIGNTLLPVVYCNPSSTVSTQVHSNYSNHN
ncbi:hypothetical protein O181_015978 [Austropuccinia psidii MF-1]|uniref:Uncharacterized protein n=1 Tax=Austropuccinia psidii MF-1 TaxID=1389203 RepID=A0A9Q3C492_9BASI|nr:hypothetical protein [Austropuccinia psidii MF-1]